jgi:hypothetical protein
MASDEPPPGLWVGWTTARAVEVSREGSGATDGLAVGVITGRMLPISAGAAEVEAAAADGLGTTVVAPTGIDGSTVTVTTGTAAGRDDGRAAGALAAFVGPAVTATTPTACALVGGFVAAVTEAVRLTNGAPLDGVPIPALKVSNDGVTSVPSDPSWHEAVPSPLGQKPVNATLPADAVSVTDTSGTVPFSAWTCTVKWASWPRATLLSDG